MTDETPGEPDDQDHAGDPEPRELSVPLSAAQRAALESIRGTLADAVGNLDAVKATQAAVAGIPFAELNASQALLDSIRDPFVDSIRPHLDQWSGAADMAAKAAALLPPDAASHWTGIQDKLAHLADFTSPALLGDTAAIDDALARVHDLQKSHEAIRAAMAHDAMDVFEPPTLYFPPPETTMAALLGEIVEQAAAAEIRHEQERRQDLEDRARERRTNRHAVIAAWAGVAVTVMIAIFTVIAQNSPDSPAPPPSTPAPVSPSG